MKQNVKWLTMLANNADHIYLHLPSLVHAQPFPGDYFRSNVECPIDGGLSF